MAGNTLYTTRQFILAIPGSGGIVTTIAERVGCVWHTAKKYIETYPTVKAAYDDEVNRVSDIAESIVFGNLRLALHKQQEDQQTVDATDAKWYLTMKGASRGYAPKQKQDIDITSGGQPITIREILVERPEPRDEAVEDRGQPGAAFDASGTVGGVG